MNSFTVFSRPSTVEQARFRASCWLANPPFIAEKTCSSGCSSATPSTRCSLATPGTAPLNLTLLGGMRPLRAKKATDEE
ncbi:hypothetical protein [Streptomyces virginiae]|uniref:hypothetical protein n=1 Tax=Streptomyces virginiae TaxID=1961 RepID=UPI003431E0FE